MAPQDRIRQGVLLEQRQARVEPEQCLAGGLGLDGAGQQTIPCAEIDAGAVWERWGEPRQPCGNGGLQGGSTFVGRGAAAEAVLHVGAEGLLSRIHG